MGRNGYNHQGNKTKISMSKLLPDPQMRISGRSADTQITTLPSDSSAAKFASLEQGERGRISDGFCLLALISGRWACGSLKWGYRGRGSAGGDGGFCWDRLSLSCL